MHIGERIKKIRQEKNIKVETLATALNVSISTIYRYENSSIEKIPVNTISELSRALDVPIATLLGNTSEEPSTSPTLPESFSSAQEAVEFMIKLPMLAAYGGYDPEKMDDDAIIEFANEILKQLELVSYKYK